MVRALVLGLDADHEFARHYASASTTKDCSQLDAGAWWGQVLEPL